MVNHESAEDLATEFNDFFISKIARIRANLESQHVNPADISTIEASILYQGTPLTSFQLTSEDEVVRIIKQSSNATSELDPLPTNLIKSDLLKELAPVITSIVNNSFSTGIFPHIYKTAQVKPLIKKPSLDANVLSNYRPVSNLPFVSKIIEKGGIKKYIT